ncbi:MAG TPA: ABC transporter permease [Solirubrobacteraceae bacterium]|jgi:ABC-2 type transport system permease protein|nr:ABC transporter permease [Solirubrobacteraceae bacterium]
MSTVRETNLIFRRAMRLSLRNPIWVILGLIQPILYLVMFGPLLENMTQVQGWPDGDAWSVFVPGLLVQLGIFGAAFVGFGLLHEMHAGVVERMRVTPASRLALLLGRVLRDVVVLFVQGLILIVTALAFGLDAPFGGLIVGLLVVALLGAAFSSASYAAALVLKSEDALAPLANGLAVPLLLLSGILLPMSLAPGWLETVSDINPLKHVVDGVRALFLDGSASVVVWGIVTTLALVAAGLAFGTRVFERESG